MAQPVSSGTGKQAETRDLHQGLQPNLRVSDPGEIRHHMQNSFFPRPRKESEFAGIRHVCASVSATIRHHPPQRQDLERLNGKLPPSPASSKQRPQTGEVSASRWPDTWADARNASPHAVAFTRPIIRKKDTRPTAAVTLAAGMQPAVSTLSGYRFVYLGDIHIPIPGRSLFAIYPPHRAINH